MSGSQWQKCQQRKCWHFCCRLTCRRTCTSATAVPPACSATDHWKTPPPVTVWPPEGPSPPRFGRHQSPMALLCMLIELTCFHGALEPREVMLFTISLSLPLPDEFNSRRKEGMSCNGSTQPLGSRAM